LLVVVEGLEVPEKLAPRDEAGPVQGYGDDADGEDRRAGEKR
jgi:hypothetical protein